MKNKIFLLGLLLVSLSFPASKLLCAATIENFSITPTSATFAEQDPDLGQVTSSPVIDVSIRISGLLTGESWTLEICADTDLVDGGVSIPAGDIQWNATSAGGRGATYYSGTLATGVYLLAGEGIGNPGGRVNSSANLDFILQNDWSYNTGNYGGAVSLRLSVPGATAQIQTVTLSTNIATTIAKLELVSPGIYFASANPDNVPSIPADMNPVSVTSSARTGSTQAVNLTCLASGDLTSGTDTIAVGNITWTATGIGYLPGAMNSIAAQTAGTWTGSGQQSGTFSYFFTNSWFYPVGDFSTTINYTLNVP